MNEQYGIYYRGTLVWTGLGAEAAWAEWCKAKRVYAKRRIYLLSLETGEVIAAWDD